MTKPRIRPKATSDFPVFREKNANVPPWKKAFLAGEKKFGQNLSKRGWSGRTWQGREFGPPETAQGGRIVSSINLQMVAWSWFSNFVENILLVKEKKWKWLLASRMDGWMDDVNEEMDRDLNDRS